MLACLYVIIAGEKDIFDGNYVYWMKSVFRFLLFVVITCFCSVEVIGQPEPSTTGSDAGFSNRWRLGLNIGPDFYYGDLNSSKFLPDNSVGFAGSVYGEYQATNVFGVRLQFIGALLNGSRAVTIKGQTVNESFTGSMAEGTINVQLNFSNLFSQYRASRKFFVYGTLGVGFAGWNTRLINPVSGGVTTDQPITAPVVPVGLGAFYRIGSRVNVGLEWSFRTIFSDNVDQTVGGFKYDSYSYLSVGVSINLGKFKRKSLKPYNYTNTVYKTSEKYIQPPPAEPLRYVALAAQPENYDYVVQICAYDKHRYSPQWIRKHYKVPQTVRMEKEGAMERFLVGDYKTLEAAIEIRDQLIRLGVRDAFVVAYKNGVRHHVVTESK